MNLIDKLAINYRENADIVNPFYFHISVKESPISIADSIPVRLISQRRVCDVEFSANPDNIRVDMKDMVYKKELTVFTKDRLITMKDIRSIDWTLSSMTGCIEFKLECEKFTVGGNNNEEL